LPARAKECFVPHDFCAQRPCCRAGHGLKFHRLYKYLAKFEGGQGFLPQYLGFGWEVFSAGGGGIGGSRWGAAFSAIRGGFSGDFEVQPGTPVLSALDSPSLPTTEGKSPRGSPALRGIKGIVVHGELRELIQDISGLP
jgi:hypothetical protein